VGLADEPAAVALDPLGAAADALAAADPLAALEAPLDGVLVEAVALQPPRTPIENSATSIAPAIRARSARMPR